eukprot:scaffold74293_cov18-Tisochrysis_lutea.AAC.4
MLLRGMLPVLGQRHWHMLKNCLFAKQGPGTATHISKDDPVRVEARVVVYAPEGGCVCGRALQVMKHIRIDALNAEFWTTT